MLWSLIETGTLYPAKMSSSKTADKYRPLFQGYLRGALNQSLSQVQEHGYTVDEDVLVQARHVLTLTLEIDDLWEQTSRLLMALSPKMEAGGLWDIWIPFLEKGIAISQRVRDEGVEAQLCLDLGTILCRQSSFTESNELLTIAKKLFEKLASPNDVALCLNQLALCALVQREYLQAVTLAQKALELFDNEHSERANSLFILAKESTAQELYGQAIFYFEEALTIRRSEKSEPKIANNLVGMAQVRRFQCDYKIAKLYLEEAIDLYTLSRNIADIADAQYDLGIIYSLMADSTTAIRYYRSAEKLYRELGKIEDLGSLYNSFGIDYTILGEWGLAQNAFEASIHIFESNGSTRNQINSLLELATLYQMQNWSKNMQKVLALAKRLMVSIKFDPDYDSLNRRIQTLKPTSR